MGPGVWKKHPVDRQGLSTGSPEAKIRLPVPHTLARWVRAGEKERPRR